MRFIFFSIIFFILTFDSEYKIEIKKIKKKNIELIKFQSPDRRHPGKDDVVAQIHFPKKVKKKNTSYYLSTWKFQRWNEV